MKKGKDIFYSLDHTGQHYDKKISAIFFFEKLEIPVLPIVGSVEGGK